MIAPASALDRVLADAARKNAEPLWTQMEAMVPPRPSPRAVPAVWRYAELRPLLGEAGELVAAEQAERRVFMLVNPAMKAPYTTDTLYAGLQLILPGEVARAHRHSAFALRFIIEGDAAFTAVGGEKVTMHRGDLVLTPSWEYHDHGHEGDGPMVWLDGLDLPVFQSFPIAFAEPYAEPRYPSTPAGAESRLRYPWDRMRARLDAASGPFAAERYADASGAPISKMMGAAAERIDAGAGSPRRRETASAVYHVVTGSGTSRIGETELAWQAGDTFCVPAWQPFDHRAAEATYLFRFDDRPLLEAIGHYRSDDAA